MERGNGFETAYNKAFHAITPNGAHEIQEELFFLLTFKKQTNMKRIIYGSGFLASFLISMGLLFKTMHWPMANMLMFSGFSALIVTSSALLFNAVRYSKRYPAAYNIRVAVGFTAAFLISVGSMFKILHYPTAAIQIATGMTLLNFVFLPMFFYHLYQQSLTTSQK